MSFSTLINKFIGENTDTATTAAGVVDDCNDAIADVTVSWHKDATDGAAGDATATRCIWRNEMAATVRVISVNYVPLAAAAAHASNYATLTVTKNDGADGTPATVATEDTSTGAGAAMVKETDWPLVLTTTAADLLVPSGSNLNFLIAKAASGVAVGGGVLSIQLRKV